MLSGDLRCDGMGGQLLVVPQRSGPAAAAPHPMLLSSEGAGDNLESVTLCNGGRRPRQPLRARCYTLGKAFRCWTWYEEEDT